MKQVLLSCLINQVQLTKQDGIFGLLNLDGKKVKDLKALTKWLTSLVMETYQTQKQGYQSQEQILQAWESGQLKLHALQTLNIALTKTTQPIGLEAL